MVLSKIRAHYKLPLGSALRCMNIIARSSSPFRHTPSQCARDSQPRATHRPPARQALELLGRARGARAAVQASARSAASAALDAFVRASWTSHVLSPSTYVTGTLALRAGCTRQSLADVIALCNRRIHQLGCAPGCRTGAFHAKSHTVRGGARRERPRVNVGAVAHPRRARDQDARAVAKANEVAGEVDGTRATGAEVSTHTP